ARSTTRPTATARGRSWSTAPGRASCGWPRRWPTTSPARRRWPCTPSRSPTWGGSSSPPRCPRARNCGWSSTSATAGPTNAPPPHSSTQWSGALAAAQLTGWDGLLAEQRAFLDAFWEGEDVVVDGDVQIQQAERFGLFHILQAGARA